MAYPLTDPQHMAREAEHEDTRWGSEDVAKSRCMTQLKFGNAEARP
jgi:hypothetical protein